MGFELNTHPTDRRGRASSLGGGNVGGGGLHTVQEGIYNRGQLGIICNSSDGGEGHPPPPLRASPPSM